MGLEKTMMDTSRFEEFDRDPWAALKRMSLGDAVDDLMIDTLHSQSDDKPLPDTTLELLCQRIGIAYTEEMKAADKRIQDLRTLGQLAELSQYISQIADTVPILRPNPWETRYSDNTRP